MSYNIRIGGGGDLVWIVEEAATRTLQEDIRRGDMINRDALYSLASSCIDNSTVLICEKDGKQIGVLGWSLSNLYNPEHLFASVIFWYVLPEHRNSRAAHLLLKTFSQIVDQQGWQAGFTIRIHSTPIKPESLERYGFKLEEYSFYKNVRK